jgi:CYTH domain-containing protein
MVTFSERRLRAVKWRKGAIEDTAEVELREPSQQLGLPPWIGKEVTDDPRFKNAHLAVNSDFWRHLE